jgi:hypothetical protein
MFSKIPQNSLRALAAVVLVLAGSALASATGCAAAPQIHAPKSHEPLVERAIAPQLTVTPSATFQQPKRGIPKRREGGGTR